MHTMGNALRMGRDVECEEQTTERREKRKECEHEAEETATKRSRQAEPDEETSAQGDAALGDVGPLYARAKQDVMQHLAALTTLAEELKTFDVKALVVLREKCEKARAALSKTEDDILWLLSETQHLKDGVATSYAALQRSLKALDLVKPELGSSLHQLQEDLAKHNGNAAALKRLEKDYQQRYLAWAQCVAETREALLRFKDEWNGKAEAIGTNLKMAKSLMKESSVSIASLRSRDPLGA